MSVKLVIGAVAAIAGIEVAIELFRLWRTMRRQKSVAAALAAAHAAAEKKTAAAAAPSGQTAEVQSAAPAAAPAAVPAAVPAAAPAPAEPAKHVHRQRTVVLPERMPEPPPPPPEEVDENVPDAEQLWQRAQSVARHFEGNPAHNRQYLWLVGEAARHGNVEAMVKLGEIAFQRGALVESYYWNVLAEMNGVRGVSVALQHIKGQWLAAGCPGELENVYDGFSARQGDFARAVLGLRSAVNAPIARRVLNDLAAAGSPEARQFLAKGR